MFGGHERVQRRWDSLRFVRSLWACLSGVLGRCWNTGGRLTDFLYRVWVPGVHCWSMDGGVYLAVSAGLGI
jgi:hypothetical protein